MHVCKRTYLLHLGVFISFCGLSEVLIIRENIFPKTSGVYLIGISILCSIYNFLWLVKRKPCIIFNVSMFPFRCSVVKLNRNQCTRLTEHLNHIYFRETDYSIIWRRRNHGYHSEAYVTLNTILIRCRVVINETLKYFNMWKGTSVNTQSAEWLMHLCTEGR